VQNLMHNRVHNLGWIDPTGSVCYVDVISVQQ
jgi:hypothetical protein